MANQLSILNQQQNEDYWFLLSTHYGDKDLLVKDLEFEIERYKNCSGKNLKSIKARIKLYESCLIYAKDN